MKSHGFWLSLYGSALLLVEFAAALPASAVAPHSSHIVSFVHQRKAKLLAKGKHDELANFDFEDVRNNANGTHTIFDRLAEQLDMTLANNSITGWQQRGSTPARVQKSQRLIQTDDSVDTKQNTLDDSHTVFGSNSHHESPTLMLMPSSGNASADVMWNRKKQSIRVLEPVRHLVNSLREGTINHTIPNRNNNHHHLISTGEHNSTSSPAIETPEERVEAEESTEFKLLEVLGSLGGMLWSFISSLRSLFAASSGNASSGSSSSSFGGSGR